MKISTVQHMTKTLVGAVFDAFSKRLSKSSDMKKN
jgi:hypothetical protein